MYLYLDFPSRSSSIGSDNTTNSNVINSTDDVNKATVFITNMIDVTITNSNTNHPISSRTPNNTFNTTSATNSSDYLNRRTVIISSLAGGLLGVFFIVCIVLLLLKRKLHKNHKNIGKFTLSQNNSLHQR